MTIASACLYNRRGGKQLKDKRTLTGSDLVLLILASTLTVVLGSLVVSLAWVAMRALLYRSLYG